jgi:hypothetical protein
MKRIALVVLLCLVACGAPGDVLSIGETSEDVKTAAAASTTDTTVTADEPGPLDGAWVGGWTRVYGTMSSDPDNDVLCGGKVRTLTVDGTLTIQGAAGVFTGSVVDDGFRWLRESNQWYCVRKVTTVDVTHAVSITVNTNTADVTCASAADCGGGFDDWKIGPAGGYAIVARRLDTDTHLRDDTSTEFDTFEFFRK